MTDWIIDIVNSNLPSISPIVFNNWGVYTNNGIEAEVESGSGYVDWIIDLSLPIDGFTITRIDIQVDWERTANGNADDVLRITHNSTTLTSNPEQGGLPYPHQSKTVTITGNWSSGEFRLTGALDYNGFSGGTNGGYLHYSSIKIYGEGLNPFIVQAQPETRQDGSQDCPSTYTGNGMPFGADPISLKTGEKLESMTDLQLNSPVAILDFTRSYRQSQIATLTDPLGLGWTHNHDVYLTEDTGVSPKEITVNTPQGSLALFYEDTTDQFVGYEGSTAKIDASGTNNNNFVMTTSDESVWQFNADKRLYRRTTASGETLTYSYFDSGAGDPADLDGKLKSVEDAYGRGFYFDYFRDTESDVYKRGLLRYVGDHTVADITDPQASEHFVVFDYDEAQEDNGGTISGSGEARLSTVEDVRGNTWTYVYENTQVDALNFLVAVQSPISGHTIKELDYTFSSSVLTAIQQELGIQGSDPALQTIDYAFQPNGDNLTTETVEGKITTHYFADGVYAGSEDADDNLPLHGVNEDYRPVIQQDANLNLTFMDWQAGGKLLNSVTDALNNQTSFSYDSQDRLIASTDAEGRVTNYVYEGSRRQPSQILIAADVATELAINGDMEANSDWIDVGTAGTGQQSQTEVSDGDNSWYVNAVTGEGIESETTISFLADKTYLITARVYVNSGIVKMGVVGDTSWDVTESASSPAEWKTLRAIHTPSSLVQGDLQFLADSGSAQFYVDSVHVIELTGLERWQQFVYDDKGRTLEEYLLNHEDATALQSTVREYGTANNENGLLESITVKDLLDSSNDSSTQYDYDAQGRVVRSHKISMFGSCEYTHTVYDEAGNVLGTACGLVTANPIPDSIADLEALYDVNDDDKKHTRITTHTYDEMGRRVTTTSNYDTSYARTSRTIYDALGRVVRSISNYIVQASSAPGDWVWDETNEEWQYSSTVSTVVSHGSELDENIISDSDYNGRGLVYRRRDLIGNVTLYGYNNADRLVKTVQNASDPDYDMSYDVTGNPDLSAYVVGNTVDADIITETVYDPNGNVVKSIDARGSVTFTVYDALNRPVKVVSNAAQLTYDILSDLSLASYGSYSTDPDKDMLSTTEYDAMGRVIRSQRLLENRGENEVWDTMLYGYDVLGRQVRTIQHASDADYDMSADSDLSAYTLSTDSDVDMLTETLYDIQGRVKETIDVNERLTRMVYDGLNRQVMTISNYVAQATAPETWEWDDTAGRWEDGSNTAIDHGTDKDQNIISQTIYDSDGRVESSRNVEGFVSRNAYDSAGRSLLRIQNFVDNSYVDPAGTVSKDPWHWDSVDGRWEDGDDTAIARGANYDQNLISKPDYDDEQRVFQSRDARGNLNRQVYDEAGRQVMSIANFVAQATEPDNWVWSSSNTRWENGSGVAIDHGTNKDQNRISTTEYDLLGRGYRNRDVAGRETYTVYDAVGRVIRRVQNYVVQGSSIPDEWEWTNDQWEDGADNAIAFGTNKDQNIISETVYNQAGQVISSRDAFGTESSFAYDNAGRRLQVTQASNTGLATSSYTCFDKAGRVLRNIANYVPHSDEAQNVISPDEWVHDENWIFHPAAYVARERNIISEMTYDRASRRVTSINPMGDTVTTTYFKDGQVDSITDPEGMVTVYRYDALRRRKLVVQSFVDNGEDPSLWVYDGGTDDRYEESDGTAIVHGTNKDENIIVMLTYDIAGRMLNMRDPRGNLTSYLYDKLGRRTELTNPLSKVWETAYAEVNGAQQTSMNYPGVNAGTDYNVVRDFDRFGRLLQMDYNDSANTPKVNFDYDIQGNRLNMTENNGTSDSRITDYSYDNLNRLTQVDFDTDGDLTVEETVSYEYDIRGLRTKLTMPGNLEIVYRYDEKGRLIALDDWDNQESRFAYDELNRHIATMRPNGMRSRYKLDGAGRLRELRHENSEREILAAFRYTVDGRGNRTQAQELILEPSATLATDSIQHTDSEVVYTGTWTNNAGFHETIQWDARMALLFVGDEDVELVIGEGPDHSIFDIYIDGTLYESVDGYAATSASRTVNISVRGDGFHRLELRNRHEQNLQSNGYKLRFQSLSVDSKLTWDVIDYSYDDLSRLIEADYNNGATVYNYGYDVAGNMVNYDGVTRTYNAANQMTNDGTNNLTYDDNGNMTNDGVNAYTWDKANRLTDVGNHSYVYDGLGNRVQQTVSSVVTDYLNDVQPGLTKLLKQDDGTNVEHFVHGLRGIHAVDDGTDWNFYAQDGLGSVRAIVDDAGVVQSSMGYDPYGNAMGAYGEGFGFTGEQTDADGSVYLRARYYEPSKGSFIKRDPAETANRYGYVSGNPINRTDPTGLLDWCTGQVQPGDTLNIIYGAAVGLGYPPQPPHLPQEEVMRLLGEANVGNVPLYRSGIGNYNLTFWGNEDLYAGGVSYINIPEHVRQAAGISCSAPPPPSVTPPPVVETIEKMEGFCPGEWFDTFLQGLEEFCEMPNTGSIADSVKQMIYDEVAQVYGNTVASTEAPLENFARIKAGCGCTDPWVLMGNQYNSAANDALELALSEDVIEQLPGLTMPFSSIDPSIAGATLQGGLASTVTEDRYVMAYVVATVENIENLLGDNSSITDVPVGKLNCGTKIQIRSQVLEGIQAYRANTP